MSKNNNNNNANQQDDLSKSVISDLYRAMGEKAASEYIKDIKESKSKEEERKVDSLFISFEKKLSKDLIRKVLSEQKGDENAAIPVLVEHLSNNNKKSQPQQSNKNNNNNNNAIPSPDDQLKFIGMLQSKFPLLETSRIQQVVVNDCSWNLKEAAERLSKIQNDLQFNTLQEMFPSFSDSEISDILRDCNNNFENAVKQFTRLQQLKENAEREALKKAEEKERQTAEKEKQLKEQEKRLIQEKQEERKKSEDQRRRLIEEQDRILREQKERDELRRFEEQKKLEQQKKLEKQQRLLLEQEIEIQKEMEEKIKQFSESERKRLEQEQIKIEEEKKRLQEQQEKLEREKTQQLFQRLEIAEQHLQNPSSPPISTNSSTTTTSSSSTTMSAPPPAEHPAQPGDDSLKVRMKVSPLVVDVGQQIYVEWEIEAGNSTAYDWIGMYVTDPPQQNKSYVTYQYRGVSEKKGLLTFIPTANGKYEFRYVRNYQHFTKTEVVSVGPVFDVTAVLTHKQEDQTSQIVVNWNQRSGNQYGSSWVGLYNRTEKNPKQYLTWNRTGKDSQQISFAAPTQPGEYEIRFFSQSYEQVAISNPIIIAEQPPKST